jgi:hypothetical protein
MPKEEHLMKEITRLHKFEYDNNIVKEREKKWYIALTLVATTSSSVIQNVARTMKSITTDFIQRRISAIGEECECEHEKFKTEEKGYVRLLRPRDELP